MSKTKLKLSYRDKRILLLVSAILVLVATYRFVYYTNMQKCKEIQKENKVLATRESELLVKSEKLDQVQEENQLLHKEIEDCINRFDDGAAYEKTILFLNQMEKEANMAISLIGFQNPKYIYTSEQPGTVPMDGVETSEVAMSYATEEETKQASDYTATEVIQASEVAKTEGVGCYVSTVSIDFKVSYEGLKKSIDFIHRSREKKNIKNLKLVYDMETGNLSGTMEINMYHLTDTGRSKPKPAIAGVSVGTKNIFGTIEVPISH